MEKPNAILLVLSIPRCLQSTYNEVLQRSPEDSSKIHTQFFYYYNWKFFTSSYWLSILNLLWVWECKSSFAFPNSKKEHTSIFPFNSIKYESELSSNNQAVKMPSLSGGGVYSLPMTTLRPWCLHRCFQGGMCSDFPSVTVSMSMVA